MVQVNFKDLLLSYFSFLKCLPIFLYFIVAFDNLHYLNFYNITFGILGAKFKHNIKSTRERERENFICSLIDSKKGNKYLKVSSTFNGYNGMKQKIK